MPSASLLRWQNDRRSRLAEVDAHCAACAVTAPPKPLLAEESLRGYVLLLSGHFQGFCRDLYTECTQVCVARISPGLQSAVQTQFSAALKLDAGNPTADAIRKDFERFGFSVGFGADPANGPRLTHLDHLNRWRNAVAHQTAAPAAPPLTIAAVRAWWASCDGLAVWLDGTMYNELRGLVGVAPW